MMVNEYYVDVFKRFEKHFQLTTAKRFRWHCRPAGALLAYQ